MNKKTISNFSESEVSDKKNFFKHFKECPIPEDELLANLGLFIRRQDLSRMLFMNEFYQKLLDVNGVIMEFGVRYGQNLALFESFRGIYEPYNHARKIIGFDSFQGFVEVTQQDGVIPQKGMYDVTPDYKKYLETILDFHERQSPISHIKKYELVEGDASKTIQTYLERNPHTIIAGAYFDFDVYKPTIDCLNAIRPYLNNGAVIGFDELNLKEFPGETVAFRQFFGNRYKIHRSKYASVPSYIIYE